MHELNCNKCNNNNNNINGLWLQNKLECGEKSREDFDDVKAKTFRRVEDGLGLRLRGWSH